MAKTKKKKTKKKSKKSKPLFQKAIEKAVDRHNRLDEKFEKLMLDTLEDSEKIYCTLIEYRSGLVTMLSALRERINQVDDELRDKLETEPVEHD